MENLGQMNYMVILRGPSGCGKSTIALQLLEDYSSRLDMAGIICSTDSFFLDEEGLYKFDVKLLGVNHKKNQNKVAYYANKDYPDDQKNIIIVDNTNLTSSEVESYAKIGLNNKYIVRLVIPPRFSEMGVNDFFSVNVHGVPLDTIRKQCERFQTNDQVGELLSKKLECSYNGQTESMYRV